MLFALCIKLKHPLYIIEPISNGSTVHPPNYICMANKYVALLDNSDTVSHHRGP